MKFIYFDLRNGRERERKSNLSEIHFNLVPRAKYILLSILNVFRSVLFICLLITINFVGRTDVRILLSLRDLCWVGFCFLYFSVSFYEIFRIKALRENAHRAHQKPSHTQLK